MYIGISLKEVYVVFSYSCVGSVWHIFTLYYTILPWVVFPGQGYVYMATWKGNGGEDSVMSTPHQDVALFTEATIINGTRTKNTEDQLLSLHAEYKLKAMVSGGE